jgi:hypothetical protein
MLANVSQRGRQDRLSMSVKIDVGLVFAIPVAEHMFGFGQLIAWQRPIFYMAGYDVTAESPGAIEGAMKFARPILLGNFFDILIRNGRWLPIKRLETPKVPFPCFKVKIGDKFYVESWHKQQKREATSEECAILQFRTNNSAIVLEDALKAHFALRPWEPNWFDCLKAEAVARSSNMFLSN